MYYNKKLMAEVGLQPPTTFDELYAACKAIREKGYIPLALGNKNRWPGCFYYVYGTARAEEGRKAVLAAAKGTANAFSHSAFATAGELIAKLTSPEVNAFNKGFQGVGTADARRLIMSDKAAMTLMGSWFIARIKGEDEAFLDNLGIAAFPFNREKANSNGGAIVGGTNCAFSISSKSEHPELAKELMKYLTDSTFAAKWAKTGRIPALTGASPEDFSPHTYRAFELMQQASYVQMYFDQLFAPKLGEAHKETVQALFSGEMSPAEVQQRMNEVMKEAR
ncbi:MAG: extracellular solute-binding protein [Planctomycetota bacterium]|nr:extracellular solute-binding protein [Planctomycetota bacterium]